MKKIISLILVVLVSVFSVVFYASAESFVYDEASFDVPEVFQSPSLTDDCDLNLIADDGSAEFIFNQYINIDGISVDYMSLDDILEYYKYNLTSFSDEFEVLNIQTYNLYGGCHGFNLDGTLYSDEEECYFDAYIFPTESSTYVFEFIVYEDDGFDYIYEVINSISVVDYSAATDGNDNNEGDSFVFIPFIIFALLIIFFGFIIGVNLKKSASGNSNVSADNDDNNAVSGSSKSSIITEKFEFNGKSINALNERFTVGRNDDNFALKELEKERREREKMFD